MATPRRRLPRVGVVLVLAQGDWAWGRGSLRLLVTAVREDRSEPYSPEWVWVHGAQLDDGDREVGFMSALVRCSAIPDELAEPTGQV